MMDMWLLFDREIVRDLVGDMKLEKLRKCLPLILAINNNKHVLCRIKLMCAAALATGLCFGGGCLQSDINRRVFLAVSLFPHCAHFGHVDHVLLFIRIFLMLEPRWRSIQVTLATCSFARLSACTYLI